MRQDNRGMTLIELIIAITIAVIIIGAATLFIRNALRSYDMASNTIDLQMESQVMMEQIGTWIMEGNRVEVDSGALIIYSIPRKAGTFVDSTGTVQSKIPAGGTVPDELAEKRVIWMQDGKLYMVLRKERASDLQPDGTNIFYTTDLAGIKSTENKVENCIGEYVSEFYPVIKLGPETAVEKTIASVTIRLKLVEGYQEYELTNEIKLRNELM